MRTRHPSGRAERAALAAAVSGSVLLAVLAPASPAPAASSRQVLSSERAVPRPCHTALLPPHTPGVATYPMTATADGVLRARLAPLAGAEGDWDLAVFDADNGTLLAASAAPRSRELAEVSVAGGRRLVVQSCRRLGPARTVSLRVDLLAPPPGSGPAPAAARTEGGTPHRSALPSGRSGYRHLYEYEYELKELARAHPSLVRSFVLPHPTVEGRDVSGVEVSSHAPHIADGKPVMLTLGLHHATEWPSGEIALEWAYELVRGYRTDPWVRGLLDRTRAVVVPVVNPDGFSVSRRATPRGDFTRFDYENKRKNCSALDAPPSHTSGPCGANPAGRDRGVDLNRNYAGFWGGVGGDPQWYADHYRGPAPFSEPETRNVRHLVSTRQVTDLVSLHTYGNLVLRPPGALDTRPPLDEPAYRALGARLASRTGYRSEPAWRLYEATGMTEDWSYWATGGFGFTLEIGPAKAHGPYADAVVAEYTGRAPAAGAGKGGNRQALFDLLAHTADPAAHATLTGTAPRGHRLRLHKTFRTPTSPVRGPDGSTGPPLQVTDTLVSDLVAPGGRFTWSVNPSTRPYVAGRYGRDPQGPAQPVAELANPPGLPPENTGFPQDPAADRVPFTVLGPPEADAGRMTVSVSWTSPRTDWDLYVLDADGRPVAQSVTGAANSEQAVLFDPPPGRYTAVVVNYDQTETAPDDWTGRVTFQSPLPATYGPSESYSLSCSDRAGRTLGITEVRVGRGERVDLGEVCARPARGAAFTPARSGRAADR
ncbi:peptidase M14 [Streptomyces inhibens]|uniref:Peptidase M14 n=1 Tax=Streptomyces inhibens TaxID=2293571 RepID=A0A371Q8Y3_STRIH|nr:M14 family metallopeptidase [Streptomyces inhibens]REK91140.1 peptidase M14 [Streptomyces inhibens]